MTPRHENPDEAPPFWDQHSRANVQKRGGRSELGAWKMEERPVAGKHELAMKRAE